MYQITFYVPAKALEPVKQALFNAGAGKVGAYDHCCWQVEGQGQYRPLSGSRPYAGQENVISFEKEFKVEMVCEDQYIKQVERALLAAHPYETPAYAIIKMENA